MPLPAAGEGAAGGTGAFTIFFFVATADAKSTPLAPPPTPTATAAAAFAAFFFFATAPPFDTPAAFLEKFVRGSPVPIAFFFDKPELFVLLFAWLFFGAAAFANFTFPLNDAPNFPCNHK